MRGKDEEKSLWMFIVVLAVLVAGAYLAYDSIFLKVVSIKQLKLSEIDIIYIYDNDENEVSILR